MLRPQNYQVSNCFCTKSERETILLAESLGRLIPEPPLTIALYGEMGAGKTIFVRGLARAFGIKKVRSPSFLIMLKYQGVSFPLYHLDLFRVENIKEIIEIGILEIIEREVVAIEWAEKLKDFLPPTRFDILIKITNSKRELSINPLGDKPNLIMKRFRESLPNFLKQ